MIKFSETLFNFRLLFLFYVICIIGFSFIVGPPIFLDDNRDKQFGQFEKEATIIVFVYCIPKENYSEITKPLYTDQTVVPNAITIDNHIKYIDAYGVSINLYITMMTFTLSSLTADDFTKYNVKLCNKHGCDNFEVDLMPGSK